MLQEVSCSVDYFTAIAEFTQVKLYVRFTDSNIIM